jgi:DNA helicase-2/ATP-dependent DNA helicase PcrA
MPDTHVIFGAPGCGKTTRLMRLLEDELKQRDPDRIAFVSFTRKGTYEGAERAQARFGYKEADLPYFRTLHSIAFRTGGYTKYDMLSKKDYKSFSDAMGMKFTGYYTEEFYSNDDKYLFIPFLRRNNPKAAESYMYDVDTKKLANVEFNFARYKEFAKVVDFTDIIEAFIARNEALPVEVAIIDEAQDLTTLQWQMCDVAFRNCKKIIVAGDDDQAIYEWSGADVERFLSIDAVTREVLKQSYRLPRRVLDLAKSVSAMISHRVDKDFVAREEEGSVTYHNAIEELDVGGKESWYFLARNNWFLSTYRDLLHKRGEVFVDKGKASYEPREIAAINAFEAMRKCGKVSDVDEMRVKLFLRDKIDLSRPWFENLNFDVDKTAYYRDLIRCKTDLKSTRLTVDTIHGVKGGEADNVVLLLDFTRAVKANFEKNPDSELRCLYVACTRAKKHLHIVHSTSKNGYDTYVKMRRLA